MITPKLNDNKVVFGPCRLSYTHLFSKFALDGDSNDGKYMTNILIPSHEKETIAAIEKAIACAEKSGIVSKWGGKKPKKLEQPLRDGDDKEKDDDGIYAGMLYLNAKCNTRPGVVDRNRQPITDEDEVYSGMWAIVSVTFYPYDVSGNRGIACGLNNVMKFKDDERLGGRSSAENDFDGVLVDSDDDL